MAKLAHITDICIDYTDVLVGDSLQVTNIWVAAKDIKLDIDSTSIDPVDHMS